jgi:hypothetical protein
MILTGRTPRLRADNYLHGLTIVIDDSDDVEVAATHFVQKMELIASIHEDVLLNVEQAQKKQRKAYAAKKGKHLFEGLITGETMVRMKKPGKKRALAASWEGPYQFMGILMVKVTLTLKRDVESVPSRMLMETSGRDPEGTFRSIMFHQTKRS